MLVHLEKLFTLFSAQNRTGHQMKHGSVEGAISNVGEAEPVQRGTEQEEQADSPLM